MPYARREGGKQGRNPAAGTPGPGPRLAGGATGWGQRPRKRGAVGGLRGGKSLLEEVSAFLLLASRLSPAQEVPGPRAAASPAHVTSLSSFLGKRSGRLLSLITIYREKLSGKKKKNPNKPESVALRRSDYGGQDETCPPAHIFTRCRVCG